MSIVIDINQKAYLNTSPITVRFIDKTYIIHFKDSFKSYGSSKSNSIFESDSNKDYYGDLYKSTIKVSNKNLIQVEMNEFALFKHTTISDLLSIINGVLKCKISTMELEPPTINKKFKLNRTISINNYGPYVSVGSGPLTFVSSTRYVSDYGFYLDDISKWYTDTCNYLTKLIKNTPVNTFTLSQNVYYCSITFYTNRPVYSNIIRIFNNISTRDKYSKIIIHDDLLDTYNNANKIQYVKTRDVMRSNNKHVIAKYNVLTLYVQQHVTDIIMIDSIDVFKDGTFKYNLSITRDIGLENIIKHMDSYFNDYLERDFNDILINECSTTESYKPLTIQDYTRTVSNITCMFTIDNASKSDVRKVDQLMSMKSFESRFGSNSSVNVNGFSFYNTNCLYSLMEEYNNRKVITYSSIRLSLIPELLFSMSEISQDESSINIRCDKFSMFDEIIFMLAFTIPLFKLQQDIIETTGDIVEDILIRLRNVPVKQNLKQLSLADPELFSTRFVSKTSRAYSALCQVKEQRPSLITEDEYYMIHRKYPDSTYNIANQTNPNNRLYMVCPHKEYPYANYHHYNDQLCIVRCTNAITNPGQYTQCSSELDSSYVSKLRLMYQSTMITKYNDNLSVGRLCYLPTELHTILPNVVCNRIDQIAASGEMTSIFRRLYNSYPIIIRRNSKESKYEILTEYDYESDTEYILVIEPERHQKYKYVCVTEPPSSRPFKISSSPELVKFLKDVYKTNKLFNTVYNHVNRFIVTKRDTIKYRVDASSTSLHKYFIRLSHYGYQLVVNNDRVVGMIHDDKYYSLPLINWDYNNIDRSIDSTVVYKGLLTGTYTYPSLDELLDPNKHSLMRSLIGDSNQTDYTYITTPDTTGIHNCIVTGLLLKILNTDVVMPCIPVNKRVDTSVSIDIDSCIASLLDTHNRHDVNISDYISTNKRLKQLINLLLERYIKVLNEQHKSVSIDKIINKITINDFIEFINKITNGFVKEKTNIVVINNLISVFDSKINKNELMEYLKRNPIDFNNVNEVGDLIYESMVNEFKLPHSHYEIITLKQFI